MKRKGLLYIASVFVLTALIALSPTALELPEDSTVSATEAQELTSGQPEVSTALPAVTGFSVTCVSGKTQYYEGETFSAEGYVGKITYDNGTELTIPGNELTAIVDSPLRYSQGGKSRVIFSHPMTELEDVMSVNVIEAVSLKITSEPKTVYHSGEDFFDFAGLKASVVYSDSTEKEIPVTQSMLSVDTAVPVTSDIQKVTVTYQISEKVLTADLPITVKKVTELKVMAFPMTAFREGTPFVCDYEEELSVYALYEGETEPVKVTQFDVPGAENPLVPDENLKAALSVALDDVTAPFSVSVIPMADITVSRKTMLHLYAGDMFNPEGLIVTVTYEDSSSADVTEFTDFTVTGITREDGTVLIAAGSAVTASWYGHEIDLSPVVTVHTGTLSLIVPPKKTEYRVGEEFSSDGLGIAFKYDDGTNVKPVLTDCKITVSSPLSLSDSHAVLDWYGYTVDVDFKVFDGKKVDRVEILVPPTTVKYVVGQSVSIDGLTLMAYYEGDTVPFQVPVENIETIPAIGSPVTANLKSIVIRYKISDTVYHDVTQYISVEEKHPSAIAVTTLPNTTTFTEGMNFNEAGMVVSMIYNDGTVLPIHGYTVSQQDPFILTTSEASQQINIVISYSGFETSFKVTVVAKEVKSLSVLAKPDKTCYRIGESFDPTGMKIILNYSGSSSPVLLKEGQYTYAPTGKLTASVTRIYITFRGLTAEIPVEVNATGVPTEITTEPEETSRDIPVYTDPPVSTEEEETNPPEPISTPDNTSSPLTVPPQTTPVSTGGSSSGGKTQGGGIDTIMVMWIVVIAVIFIGLVILIIYYKRHFT